MSAASASRTVVLLAVGLVAAGSVAVAACSLVFPVPDANVFADGGASSHGGGGGGGGGGGVTVDAGVLVCAQTGRGPALVPAGDRVCVDATPVSREQYSAFLDASVPLTPQTLGCESNSSWTPLGTLDPGDAGPVMVDGVDWCDAWGYCAWAGKTLCGGFPGQPIPGGVEEDDGGFLHGLDFQALSDRDASAMAWACEGGDAGLVYPYGNDLDPAQCYPQGLFAELAPEPSPIGSRGCVGGFPGLVDMVGVFQWVDSCSYGQCSVQGTTCRDFSALSRSLDPQLYPQYESIVGFRCCGVDAPTR